MVYEITGVYPSQTFFSLRKLADGSARVLLQEDLRADNLQLRHYVIRLRAFDSVYPDAIATSVVNVIVERNRNGPRFQPQDIYELALSDSFQVGEPVLQVLAVDEDEDDVIRYEAADVTATAWQVFLLDERTGTLFLIQPLTDAQPQFEVRSIALL